MILDALEGFGGELVGLDLILELRGRDLLANAIGYIAQVAEGRRIVAVEDRRHDIFLLTAADGLDEVSLVVLLAALRELFDLLIFVVISPAAVFARQVIAIFALDVDADADEILEGIHDRAALFAGQATDFEDKRRGLVVVDGNFSIRSCRVIVVAKATAEGEDALGERFLAEHPAALVHLVHALVADVAV